MRNTHQIKERLVFHFLGDVCVIALHQTQHACLSSSMTSPCNVGKNACSSSNLRCLNLRMLVLEDLLRNTVRSTGPVLGENSKQL